MINLDEFLVELFDVELSQHAWGKHDNAYQAKKLPRILRLVKKGVKEIHREFLIKRGVAQIIPDGSETYLLNDDTKPYIEFEKTPINFMGLLDVIDLSGNKVSINRNFRYGLSNNVYPVEIQMLSETEFKFLNLDENNRNKFNIEYRRGAVHIPIPTGTPRFNPEDYEIDLPSKYEQLLMFYIAQRLFPPSAPLEGYSATYNPAVLYGQKYDKEINRLRATNDDLNGLGSHEQRFSETGLP